MCQLPDPGDANSSDATDGNSGTSGFVQVSPKQFLDLPVFCGNRNLDFVTPPVTAADGQVQTLLLIVGANLQVL